MNTTKRQQTDDRSEAPLPDEDPDIRREAAKFFADAEQWLDMPNVDLGGRSPIEFVTAGDEEPVRDLLRSIKYIGVS